MEILRFPPAVKGVLWDELLLDKVWWLNIYVFIYTYIHTYILWVVSNSSIGHLLFRACFVHTTKKRFSSIRIQKKPSEVNVKLNRTHTNIFLQLQIVTSDVLIFHGVVLGTTCEMALSSKLTFGYTPLMLYDGDLSCQTRSGKVMWCLWHSLYYLGLWNLNLLIIS